MAYIGTSPSNGVRRRFVYEATASQTSFSGNDENGITLTYVDSLYLDVYQNGVKLKAGDDYTATTGTTVVLAVGASANDVVEMVAFDVFSVNDSVSASDGGNFAGNIGMGGTLSITGGIVSPVTINGTTPTLTIGDAGAEDAKIVFDGNAVDYHIGLDDSADSLIIGKGSALGTTTSMAIDANGIITKPLQPAFLAQPSSQQANLSLDPSPTIVFGTEIFDQNGDFSSNTFTAPITGRYQLQVMVRADNVDTAANFCRIVIVTSNRNYIASMIDPARLSGDPGEWNFNGVVLADMDANDTAHITWSQSGGAAQTDIETDTFFSGYLVA